MFCRCSAVLISGGSKGHDMMFMFIISFSDPSCPLWKHLHLICFQLIICSVFLNSSAISTWKMSIISFIQLWDLSKGAASCCSWKYVGIFILALLNTKAFSCRKLFGFNMGWSCSVLIFIVSEVSIHFSHCSSTQIIAVQNSIFIVKEAECTLLSWRDSFSRPLCGCLPAVTNFLSFNCRSKREMTCKLIYFIWCWVNQPSNQSKW